MRWFYINGKTVNLGKVTHFEIEEIEQTREPDFKEEYTIYRVIAYFDHSYASGEWTSQGQIVLDDFEDRESAFQVVSRILEGAFDRPCKIDKVQVSGDNDEPSLGVFMT